MCKFHKDVARDIATDPVTGEFNPGKYSVALVAMAHFRIEQYMPAMFGNDGFVPASMTTEEAMKALEGSGLKKSLEQIQAYRDAQIGALHAAIELTAQSCDLSMPGLNIRDNITKDGYKHCGKMPADPTRNGPFLSEAVVELYKGYDDKEKTWARGTLTLLNEAHKPQFEAIRMATEHFVSQPGVKDALRQMFEGTLARIFQTAQADLAAGKGFEKTDGCAMCGHGERKQKPQPNP